MSAPSAPPGTLSAGSGGARDALPPDTLWLGAHKTGTTFLQKSLQLSQPALEEAGLACPELETFRSRYTRPLLYDGHFGPPGPPGRQVAGPRLIFDENIAGLVQHALGPAGLYPDIAPRALRVAAYLGMEHPRLVLAVRDFAGFLPSLYAEALKSSTFRRFHAFQRTPRSALSWSDVLDRLRVAFPQSEILVYSSPALPGREGRLLARLTGLSEDRLQLLTGRERAGPSHDAIAALHALSRHRRVTRADLRAAVRQFPRGPGHAPGFNPWTAEERALLDRSYAADLSRIRARSDVVLLDPDPPA